jgi:hypothetical protein
MSSNTKSTVLAAAAGLLVAGVVVAIVATQFGSSGTSNVVATTYLTQPVVPVPDGAGTRVGQLVAAAKAQQQNRLELTQTFFNSFFASLSAAASYFGVSWPTLRGRLEAGNSLAQLASTAGKSKDDLVATMIAAHRRYLDDAVVRHEIDKTQEQVLLVDVDPWMQGVVAGTGSNRGFGGTIGNPLPTATQIPASANGVPAPRPLPTP